GVDQGQAVSRLDIVAGQVLDQRRFAGSGLAHDVHVAAAVLLPDAEPLAYVAVVSNRERRNGVLVGPTIVHLFIVLSALALGEAGTIFSGRQKYPACERAWLRYAEAIALFSTTNLLPHR